MRRGEELVRRGGRGEEELVRRGEGELVSRRSNVEGKENARSKWRWSDRRRRWEKRGRWGVREEAQSYLPQ